LEKLQNDLFLKACKKEPVERTPIWIMRQAGRYLPEYRKVRQQADFLTMCKTPELAAEVTIQPVDIIGVDAAIVFSDILVVPEAMGMKLQMQEKIGPVFLSPIKDETDVNSLKQINPFDNLGFVLETIKLVKKELNGKVPLIGFSGSPWTLMAYMVEGRGSKNFAKVKSLIFNRPDLAHQLLSKITLAVTDYLNAQLFAGADAVQIFDTWGGILSYDDFKEFSLNYIQQILKGLNRNNNQPVIYFPKGVHANPEDIADTGVDVLSVDWTVNIGEIRKRVGNSVALQGNLDPTVLYAHPSVIKEKARKVLESYGKGSGHIFNLGHGILPDVPVENVKALVDFVKEFSSEFH